MFVAATLWAATPDPSSFAAHYYFKKHAFREALRLWEETLRKDPQNLEAILKIADLKLLEEGRSASRELLRKFIHEHGSKLTSVQRRAVREHWIKIQNTFVSDLGQSYFLQAEAFLQKGETARAVPLLSQSDSFENGNTRVLVAKAKGEKGIGDFSAYLSTLKMAWETNPYDPSIRENLVTAFLNFKQFDKVIATVVAEQTPLTATEKLAYGFALLQTNSLKEARPILQELFMRASNGKAHPALYYAMGKVLLEEPGRKDEAKVLLEKFVSMSPTNCKDGNWDPFACSDLQTEAKKILEPKA